jgi:hypothetical protein
MDLWCDANEFSALQKGGAIIKFTEHSERKPHSDNHVGIVKRLCNFQKRSKRFLQQKLLMEQITTGVTRNAELRENDNCGPFVFGEETAAYDFISIEFRIRNFQSWAHRSDSVKTEHFIL